MKTVPRGAFLAAALAALNGCSRAPTFNVLGSFFPSWLICVIAGICLAALVNWGLTRMKRERMIAWPVLTYPCLAALFSFVLWLLLFS